MYWCEKLSFYFEGEYHHQFYIPSCNMLLSPTKDFSTRIRLWYQKSAYGNSTINCIFYVGRLHLWNSQKTSSSYSLFLFSTIELSCPLFHMRIPWHQHTHIPIDCNTFNLPFLHTSMGSVTSISLRNDVSTFFYNKTCSPKRFTKPFHSYITVSFCRSNNIFLT